jgi:hypothetical protein
MRGSEIVRELMIYAGKESEALEPVDVSEIAGTGGSEKGYRKFSVLDLL